jgi:branched-chain amino acid transport system permease protein
LTNLSLLAQLIVSGIVVGSSYALLGVSFGIVYSTTKIFHMANAVLYTLAAYTAVVCQRWFGLSLWVAIPAAVIAAGVAGVLLELGAYRPMRARGGTLMTIFLVSLGLTLAAQAGLQLVFGGGGIPVPGFPIRTIALGTVTLTTLDITQVVVAWFSIGLLLLFLRTTRYGRAIAATRSNPAMALAVGVPIARVYVLVFLLGGVFVGIAALLFAMENVANPGMGVAPILISFIAVFLGGVNSVPGAALGGLVVGLVSSLTALFLSGDFGPVAAFGLLFILLIIRPQGLFDRVGA